MSWGGKDTPILGSNYRVDDVAQSALEKAMQKFLPQSPVPMTQDSKFIGEISYVQPVVTMANAAAIWTHLDIRKAFRLYNYGSCGWILALSANPPIDVRVSPELQNLGTIFLWPGQHIDLLNYKELFATFLAPIDMASEEGAMRATAIWYPSAPMIAMTHTPHTRFPGHVHPPHTTLHTISTPGIENAHTIQGVFRNPDTHDHCKMVLLNADQTELAHTVIDSGNIVVASSNYWGGPRVIAGGEFMHWTYINGGSYRSYLANRSIDAYHDWYVDRHERSSIAASFTHISPIHFWCTIFDHHARMPQGY